MSMSNEKNIPLGDLDSAIIFRADGQMQLIIPMDESLISDTATVDFSGTLPSAIVVRLSEDPTFELELMHWLQKRMNQEKTA